jgi:two-component system, NarL family, invasion response regulator UvrY
MAEVLKLGIVDDHKLFRKGMITLIDLAYPKCEILFEADNGLDLQNKLLKKNLPEIIIMDVNMPGMDGFASAQWLKENYPEIKVLVVSMVEKEETIVRMLKLGVKGYLSKDVEPQELGEALRSIMNRGFYYTDYLTGKLVMSIQSDGTGKQKINILPQINDREKLFLELACSELTYNEIADKMFLSPKTIDGYRNSLFEKLNVKSRVGLALYAVRHGMVSL